MLELLAGTREKSEAQQSLERTLKRNLPSQGIWNIGYPGGNANHELYSKGSQKLWYAPSRPNPDNAVPRYWNSFGIYSPDARTQTITIEANVPQRDNTGWVAAFFARDPLTDAVFLMHSGRVGGGGKGVGKFSFLAWSNPALEDVSIGADKYRSAILIGRVDDPRLPDRIWRLVRQVDEFKKLAKAGTLNTPQFRQRLSTYKKYSKGFSGRKAGRRAPVFDYVTYHDDVVDQVAMDRESRLGPLERPVKTNLIDFAVAEGERLTEIYEIKTSADRPSLYSALGQLLSYSAMESADVRLILVLPRYRNLPAEIEAAIRRLGIEIRTYQLKGGGTNRRVVLDPA